MKKLIFVLLCIFSLSQLLAQEKQDTTTKRGFKKENLFISGNFGVSFGNYTLVNVSPQVGYRFSQYFAAGVGINVQYVSIKYFDNFGNAFSKQSQGVYGVNLFARAYPIRQVFVQVQPEFNFINGKLKYYNSAIPTEKFNTSAPSLLAGIGVGFNGAYISLMYDLLQNKNSPYNNRPFINVGFGF